MVTWVQQNATLIAIAMAAIGLALLYIIAKLMERLSTEVRRITLLLEGMADDVARIHPMDTEDYPFGPRPPG